jgi:hypothetical protein
METPENYYIYHIHKDVISQQYGGLLLMLEYQRRIRIRLAVAAWAYEFMNDSIMPDAEYDRLSLEVDSSIETGNKVLDRFFKEEFDPSTSLWVYKHPHKGKLKKLYYQFFAT